jgi:hypothetical protein
VARLFTRLLRAALLLPMFAACANQQLYNGIQKNQQLECQKLPGSQYDECMKEVSEPYESYERDREELMKDDQQG